MANPNDLTNGNNLNKNKEKEGKEFVRMNDHSKPKNINVEAGFKSKHTKPVAINFDGNSKTYAIGEGSLQKKSQYTDWETVKKIESNPKINTSGGLSGTPPTVKNKLNTNTSGGLKSKPVGTTNPQKNTGGGLGVAPSTYVPPTPKGPMPNVTPSPTPKNVAPPIETTEKVAPKQTGTVPSGTTGTPDSQKKEAPKEKKEAPKGIFASDKLKGVLGILAQKDKNENGAVPTGQPDKDGAKQIGQAKNALTKKKKSTTTSSGTTNTTSVGGTSTPKTTEPKKEEKKEERKEDPKAKALAAFDVKETDEEIKEDAEAENIKNEGKNRGLMVGRSLGYGAKLTPAAGGKFSITKFSESDDPAEEETAKNKYDRVNTEIAKNMEEYGTEEKPESGVGTPMKGYYDAYIQGYNEGYREGETLKAEAAAAERTAQMEKEQGSEEYKVGASLGMTCGVLLAKGEKNVDTKFSMTKDGKYHEVIVKTTVAELENAASEKKQTPGGELSGPAYEKAFLLHFNQGYRQAQNQRKQAPKMDENYKATYEQGYQLGVQQANGESGAPDLLKLEKTFEGKDERELKGGDMQRYRGFYAGYNKGYAQVQEGKKNKAKAEREAKYKKPNFVAGYSTGNLKGFLSAMIESSGIDLLTALNDPDQMEAAGVPKYFPIPDELRESIKATLIFGEVADKENESNPTKALLGKPLFKEGLLMGFNQGYRQGQNSRVAFKRDKHKMHPDYQRSILVLMPSDESTYAGPTETGNVAKGFTMGQLLANAEFEKNELLTKNSRSKEEEKRLTDLTKAIDALNGVVGAESSYYKLGVDEYFNWWTKELIKKAQTKKQEEGYAGAENSPKRKGFNWGLKVGAKVIEGKEKLKELNRKGRDIKSRSAQLNAAIKASEKEAKVTSKNQGGEDYFVGYRNGYNHAFRVAKEGKKSDKGNLDTDDLFENASGKGSYLVKEIYDKVITKVNLGGNLTESALRKGVESAHSKFKGKTQEAFEDGLARGYSSGYSTYVVDAKTGKPENNTKEDEAQIRDQYKTYKGMKTEDGKLQYAGDMGAGMLYFFLIGYQYHNKDKSTLKYGLPKGKADAESFNLGYRVAEEESKGGKIADRSGEATSKAAYQEGYRAAKYQARYNAFKKGMIRSIAGEKTATGASGNHKKGKEETAKGNDKGGGLLERLGGFISKLGTDPTLEESVTDASLTGGLAELAEKENVDLNKEKEDKERFYLQGNNDATSLWTKIIYMRKGVKLEGVNIPKEITFRYLEGEADLEAGETVTITDSTDLAVINDFYGKKDAYIKKIANYYIEENYTKDVFLSIFSLDFSTLGDALQGYDKSKEKAKEAYIKGYQAKVASIESNYKDKFMQDWLQDYGYYMGITEMAPETAIEVPSAPYAQMSGDEIDYESSYYKTGYLEGIKVGVLIKNGVIQPSDADLATASGDEYKQGFDDGQSKGREQGALDAQEPHKEPPSRREIVQQLDDDYRRKNKGKHDAMNYDYKSAYVKAYFEAYWTNRDYEYGKLLGYDRGLLGGDAMFNVEPEDGVRIDDKDAFFKGVDEGRSVAIAGLPKEALYGAKGKSGATPKSPLGVIQKITAKYAERNAAIDAVHELKLSEKIIRKIVYSQDPFYSRYKKLNTIKALGVGEQSMGSLGELLVYYEVKDLTVVSDYLDEGFNKYLNYSFADLSEDERVSCWQSFESSYKEAYQIARAQSLAELNAVAMTAALDKRKEVSSGGMGGEIDNGLGESGNSILNVLKDLLFGDSQDFYLDDLLLLDMFFALETKVEEVQYHIEDDLREIEVNQMLAEMGEDESLKEDLKKLKRLEKELKEGNLSPGESLSKEMSINILKAEIESKRANQQQIYHDWQAAEAAAKEKIDSIRLLMKDSLAFDTPLESNEDILTYIKINLESSEGNREDIYEDIDIFNDLVLSGLYTYKESDAIEASVLGSGNFYLDHYAENVHIENAEILMQQNGFEIKARGLSYVKSANELTFMSGSLVTPSIEGGAHMGQQYQYNFDDFSVNLNEGVKSQMDAQKYKLQGGPL